jgi:eukaryotic-like serine/threonine-protein kinase
MSAPTDASGTLAGYRLVRRLGVGSRADVYLGVGTTGSAALKVFAPTTSRESVGAELEALGRLDSPHLVRLVDVSSASGDLPILVLERVQQESVSALLVRRGSLECGEVVTVLAPIAALVGEMHGAGLAHGHLGVASVHLGSRGEPVLLGLGHCELFAAGGSMAAIDSEPAAATDRDALASMALGVLASVRDAGPRVSDLARWIESAPRAYEFPGELAERLFACAEPLPVAISEGKPVQSAIPARVAPAAPVAVAAAVSLPELLENPFQVVRKRAIDLARGIRLRFWVAAAAVAVGLILAVALIPSGGDSRATSSAPSRALTESTAVPTASSTPSPLPDDPLLASKILLAARTTCIRDLSILCLDTVDEPSSAAFASDAALIQQVQGGGEVPKSTVSSGDPLTLTERLGDTALIGLGDAGSDASILVIRTAVGWRIRDYLSGVQATAAPTG